MRIGVATTPGTSSVIVVIEDGGRTLGYELTRDEAAAMRDTLTSAINTVDRAADPYHLKRLTFSIRDDITVADVLHWRAVTCGDGDAPIYPYASYVLEDLRSQATNDNIAEILAWGEANPGHPFVFIITDETSESVF
jgi:hypothetical protein